MHPTTPLIVLQLNMKKTLLKILFVGCVSVGAENAHAQAAMNLAGRIAITDMKQALRTALSAPVSGYFAGELASYTAREFKSASLVLVDVSAVATHPQAGCKRLRVQLQQAGVQVPDSKGLLSKPTPQAMTFSINFCADGTYPVGESGTTQ